MATWFELTQFVQQNAQTERMDTGMLKALLNYEDGRSQLAFVLPAVPFADVSIVTFMSPIGAKSAIPAAALMEEFTPFGFRAFGDLYMVSHSVVLDTLDAPEAAFALHAVAAVADELEKKYVGGDQF